MKIVLEHGNEVKVGIQVSSPFSKRDILSHIFFNKNM